MKQCASMQTRQKDNVKHYPVRIFLLCKIDNESHPCSMHDGAAFCLLYFFLFLGGAVSDGGRRVYVAR